MPTRKSPARPRKPAAKKPAAKKPAAKKPAAKKPAAARKAPRRAPPRGDVAAVDAYLAKLNAPFRTLLTRLRGQIARAAPEATERIAYGMPAFYTKDGPLLAYAAFTAHCSLFGMSGDAFEAVADELSTYKTSKGGVQFTLDHPLPASLVARIVKLRLAKLAARQAERAAARKPSR